MALLEYIEQPCPWCGEPTGLTNDLSAADPAGHQQTIEDCQVCCQPMVVDTQIDMGLDAAANPPTVELRREGG